MGVRAKVKQRWQYWLLSVHAAIIQALTKLLLQEYFNYVTQKALNQKQPTLVTHNWSQKYFKCIFFKLSRHKYNLNSTKLTLTIYPVI